MQVILQALKTYGMMLADNGSAWYISGVPDKRWDNDALHELHQVHGSDFEAVDVSSLIGLAWNVATYLVVPVLVVEGVGPVEAIKRSVDLLKRTWGEQIAGNFSIGLVFGLLSLLVVLLGVPAIALAAMSESVALVVLAVLVLVLALVFMGLINSTLSGIYTAAVYQYAVTGETGSYFRQDLVQHAFRHK